MENEDWVPDYNAAAPSCFLHTCGELPCSCHKKCASASLRQIVAFRRTCFRPPPSTAKGCDLRFFCDATLHFFVFPNRESRDLADSHYLKLLEVNVQASAACLWTSHTRSGPPGILCARPASGFLWHLACSFRHGVRNGSRCPVRGLPPDGAALLLVPVTRQDEPPPHSFFLPPICIPRSNTR